jgi:L-fuconolactonase
MLTEADWKNWKASDFMFYLDTIFEAFGPNRVMIGSDWPVCIVAGSYNQVIELVINYLKKLDPKVKNMVLGETCYFFYLNKKNNHSS